MTPSERFEKVTGMPPTKKNVTEFQRRVSIKDDGICGPVTAAVAEMEFDRLGFSPPFPDPEEEELLFLRRPGAARTLTQRDFRGNVRYECVLRVRHEGEIRQFECNTMPMQVSSKASPQGHVAVVRPGTWLARTTLYKGKPALRIRSEPLCWRNLDGLPVLTASDYIRSEGMQPREYPQVRNPGGTYATDILFHAGPPHGFSIGCFTAPLETVQWAVTNAPQDGWRVRLEDLG